MSSAELPEIKLDATGDIQSAQRQLKSMYLYLALDLASVLPIALVAVSSGSILLLTDVLDYGKGIFSALISIAILRSITHGRTGSFEHGMGRLSVLGTLFMSAIINTSLLGGIGIAIARLIHPVSIENGYTVAGAIFQFFGIGINLWLMLRNLKIARETKSALMDATWRMAFADTILAAGILVAICLTYAFSRYQWALYIDPVCAIVALSVGISSYVPLLKKIVAELADRSIEERYHLAIMRSLARHFDLYNDFHNVKTRYSGGKPYIRIELSFPGELSVTDALVRVDAIKSSIAEEIENADIDIVIVPPAVVANTQ